MKAIKLKVKTREENQENKFLELKILGKYPDNKEYLLCGAGKTSVNIVEKRS